MSFRKARLLREAEASKCLKDVVANCVCESCWMKEEVLDCGCINHGDDESIGCQSCEYVSCLDCHHINSQSINSNEWVCYEGYGCQAETKQLRSEEE